MSRPKSTSESVVRRQEVFRSGRLAAYAALKKAGFSDPISEVHRISVVGKNPDRSPCWPTGFVGSITHSDNWVLAVAARSSDYQSLGIDSEIMVAERLAKDLQPNIGTPSEWKLIDDAGMKLTSAFTLLFSAKESFYKCWYPLKRKFMDHPDVQAYDIMPDRCDSDSNANYGVIALRPRTSHTYDDKREVDAMQLAIRYCITPRDVFTIAILKKANGDLAYPNPKREQGANSIIPHNKTQTTPILKSKR